MTFWWNELDRQVRIEGRIKRVSADMSDQYFAKRPRGSQIGAVASAQSRPLPDRQALLDAVEKTKADFDGKDVQRPENWGGFLLRPDVIEFWQGRPSRLHDRIRYHLDANDEWVTERLAP